MACISSFSRCGCATEIGTLSKIWRIFTLPAPPLAGTLVAVISNLPSCSVIGYRAICAFFALGEQLWFRVLCKKGVEEEG